MFEKVLVIILISVSVITYRVPYLDVTYKEVVTNKRHLTQYIRCFTNTGVCPPQATYIKRILPEIIKTNCSKCNPQLNEVVARSMSMMKEKQPGEWNRIMEKYNHVERTWRLEQIDEEIQSRGENLENGAN